MTWEQLDALLWRYADSPSSEAGEDFADEDSIADYAGTAVDWARSNGIITGQPGNLFAPKAAINRAEVTAILYRYLTGGEDTPDTSGTGSAVYMTTAISPEGLMAVYEALDWTPTGRAEVNTRTEKWCDNADEILEYMAGEDRLRDVITQVKVWERTI